MAPWSREQVGLNQPTGENEPDSLPVTWCLVIFADQFLALTCWEFSTDLSSITTYGANQHESGIWNKLFFQLSN